MLKTKLRFSLVYIFYLYCVLYFFGFAIVGKAETKELRWAGDADSGAPYAFYDPRNPKKMIGFEVDLIRALAEILHRDPVFVQNAWEGLIPGLQRNEYDIAVNGIEITEDRKERVLFSDPYFSTFLQIVVRKEEGKIRSFADLKGKRVGTLTGAFSERVLRAEPAINVVLYESEFNAHQDLINGRTDAILFDEPIVKYYTLPNPDLKVVGEPIGSVFYGIALRKSDTDLVIEINQALGQLKKSGKLREILERWNIWNSRMSEMLNDHRPTLTPASEYTYFLSTMTTKKSAADRLNQYRIFIPTLLRGALNTMLISISAMLLAIALGLVIALFRLYGVWPLNWLAAAFVELMRGTPLLLQLFFIFYALPSIGIKFPPLVAAILGLGLNYAASEAENYRAGITSVGKEQMEAAFALGMTQWQALVHIILPQGLRLVIPPITNDFIALLKDSSLVSVITLVELTKVYSQLSSTYYDYIGTGLLTASIYLLMGMPFVKLAKYFERRLAWRNYDV